MFHAYIKHSRGGGVTATRSTVHSTSGIYSIAVVQQNTKVSNRPKTLTKPRQGRFPSTARHGPVRQLENQTEKLYEGTTFMCSVAHSKQETQTT